MGGDTGGLVMEVKKKSCLLINEAGFKAYCLTYRILQFCLQLPRSLHISPVIQVFPSHDQNIYSIPWSVNSSLLSTSEPTIVTWLQKEPWQVCFLWHATSQKRFSTIFEDATFVGRCFQGASEAMCISMGYFIFFM